MVCTCPSCPPYSNRQWFLSFMTIISMFKCLQTNQIAASLTKHPKIQKKPSKRASEFIQKKQMIHLPLWVSSSLWRAHIAGI